MKTIFFITAIVLISNIVIAGSYPNNQKQENAGKLASECLQQAQTINSLDSVFFDLTQATANGNSIEFPIFIKSDDVINALDFSFKYNQANLLYDTIINPNSTIQTFVYYNSSDSTVRFTSNSLTAYPKGISLVFVRFTVLSSQMISTDLNTLKVYLNGDMCSYKLIGSAINIGIDDLDKNNWIKIYPNPSTGYFAISSGDFVKEITVFNIAGKNVYQNTYGQSQLIIINLQNQETGIYFLKIVTDNGYSIQKIILNSNQIQ